MPAHVAPARPHRVGRVAAKGAAAGVEAPGIISRQASGRPLGRTATDRRIRGRGHGGAAPLAVMTITPTVPIVSTGRGSLPNRRINGGFWIGTRLPAHCRRERL